MLTLGLGHKAGLPPLGLEGANTLWHWFRMKETLKFCGLSSAWACNASLINEMSQSVGCPKQNNKNLLQLPSTMAPGWISPVPRAGCWTVLFHTGMLRTSSFVLSLLNPLSNTLWTPFSNTGVFPFSLPIPDLTRVSLWKLKTLLLCVFSKWERVCFGSRTRFSLSFWAGVHLTLNYLEDISGGRAHVLQLKSISLQVKEKRFHIVHCQKKTHKSGLFWKIFYFSQL